MFAASAMEAGGGLPFEEMKLPQLKDELAARGMPQPALGTQGDAAAQAAHRARARSAIRCDGHVMYLVYVHVYGSRTIQLYHCRGRWERPLRSGPR